MTVTLPFRPEFSGLEPYGAPQLDTAIRLNVNENPYAPPPKVVAAITKAVANAANKLNRYPDRDFHELRAALANYLNDEANVQITPNQIWAANGSNEVMLHLFQSFGGPGRSAISFTPTYSMYPEYARDTHTNWVEIGRTDSFELDLPKALAAIGEYQPALIILTSPNNPTGTALTLAEITAILEAAKGVKVPGAPEGSGAIVVVDEAYAEFRRAGVPSALELLKDWPNLAVSRTMSKAFAAAGLRLGYLAGSAELVMALQLVRLPYHLSALTQAAALAALNNSAKLQSQVEALRVERDQLYAWLQAQTDQAGRPLAVAPSDANFIMFGTFANRHDVWQQLAAQGVLIREVGPPGWLRVSIGTPSEMASFRKALGHALAA